VIRQACTTGRIKVTEAPQPNSATPSPNSNPNPSLNPGGQSVAGMSKATRIVIGIGLLVVLFAVALLIDGPGLAGGSQLLAYTLLLAVPICLIVYFFFVQGKHIGIIIGSMIAAFFLSGLTMVMKTGSKVVAVQDEAKMLSQIEYDKNGNLILPPDMDQTSPVSQAVTKYATDMSAIQTSVKLDMEASGMVDLFNAQKLSSDGAILRDCPRVSALAVKMDTHRKDTIAVTDKFRRDINRMDVDPEVRKGLLQGMNGTNDSMAQLDKMWSLQGDMVKESYQLCLTLAKKTWTNKGGTFTFNSRRDMNSFQDIVARIDGINKQITALQEAGAANLRVQSNQMGSALSPGG
jgi:uncharacterized membrane protein